MLYGLCNDAYEDTRLSLLWLLFLYDEDNQQGRSQLIFSGGAKWL